ncbi:MAG TPA: glycogen synthase GlgA [Candidatus Acidoferrales bacterium]|nr:glycogen synthase GlgA [Candidatus Acidoferrales bacterium]
MNVLMISSEVHPLAKSGGLGDMVSSLAAALTHRGTTVSLVLPAYRSALKNADGVQETKIDCSGRIAGRLVPARVFKTMLAEGLAVYLVGGADYFDRPGLYGTADGDYPDNVERFAFFTRAALDLAPKIGRWDVLHCHDWQAALVPVFRKAQKHLYPELRDVKDVLTIHNLAYQGIFPPSSWSILDLPYFYFSISYLEFYGNINLLKGGIVFADALTTVSRRYAREITTPEYGCGLDGVIRSRRADLVGILNGVDYREWNPSLDPHIKKNYGPEKLYGKRSCKAELQQIFGLPRRSSVPLLAMVSRLVEQKGLDIFLEVVEDILRYDLQLIVLGTGEQKYETALTELAPKYSGRLAVRTAFDNRLAHKIEAGADLFLMPSKFEPCGLNQMYSMKYGTIPIVRATGGLDDTIEDFDPLTMRGTGIKFPVYSGPALLEAVKRALAVYTNRRAWNQLVKNAMRANFSWENSAAQYARLYDKLVKNEPVLAGEND